MSQNPMQEDPRAYWNDQAAQRWIAAQDMLDRAMQPVTDSLFEAAALVAGERVVDIGCGCGTTTFEAARRVTPGGRVVGVDVSAPMVEHARSLVGARAGGADVSFVIADATDHGFDDPADAAISRFGVMFFPDPAAAFANLAGALAPGGRCAFAVWQHARHNPWMSWPLEAMAAWLPDDAGPPPDDDVPGPFRYADRDRFAGVLAGAGFADIDIDSVEGTMAYDGDEAAVFAVVEKVGPFSRARDALEPAAAVAATEAVKRRLAELHDGAGVRFPGRWWIAHGRVA